MLAMTVKMNPDNAPQLMEAYGEDFLTAAQQAHNTWVMRVLEYIVKFSRVDTGRSRAGWFNFMDLNGYDYHRSLPPGGQSMAVEEGRGLGQSVSEPFSTTIINNVKYVEPMNRRFGLFGFTHEGSAGSVFAQGHGYVSRMTEGTRQKGVRRVFGVSEHGNRISMGIRLEERIPIFEQYGQENWQRFCDQAQAALEAGGRKFKPGKIGPVDNPPPTTL